MGIAIHEDFHLGVVDVPDGQECHVYDQKGNDVGILVRCHPSSGANKIAGDYPGLDPALFTVDDGGHLVNG